MPGPGKANKLREHYRDTVVGDLTRQFGYKSLMAVPRIIKITLNMGLGEAVADKKIIDHAVDDLQRIAGQKPVVTKARKSIANFKIRDGWPIGCMVTLRRERMYEFLDRLIHIAMPGSVIFEGCRPGLRRPRELQLRRQGADYLPGDRLRQDRRDPRPRCLYHHHRAQRRGGARPPHGVLFSPADLRGGARASWPRPR